MVWRLLRVRPQTTPTERQHPVTHPTSGTCITSAAWAGPETSSRMPLTLTSDLSLSSGNDYRKEGVKGPQEVFECCFHCDTAGPALVCVSVRLFLHATKCDPISNSWATKSKLWCQPSTWTCCKLINVNSFWLFAFCLHSFHKTLYQLCRVLSMSSTKVMVMTAKACTKHFTLSTIVCYL